MKNVWSVLCHTSIRDKDTNRTSLINTIESIGFIVDKEKLEKHKNIPVNLEIVGMWSSIDNNIDDFLIKIDFINNEKKVLDTYELLVKKPDDNVKAVRNVVTKVSITVLPVNVSGQYIFKISQKKSEDKKYSVITELPLEIRIKYNDAV